MHPRSAPTRAVPALVALVALVALLAGACSTDPTGAPGSASTTGSTATATGSRSGPTPAASAAPMTSSRGATARSSASATRTTSAAGTNLPRGGQTVFPAYRLVGFSGAPGSPALGRLGVGDLDARVKEIEKVAAPYAKGRKILPVLELITTVVHGSPGRDGKYRSRMKDTVIGDYLAAARRHRAILLLNIQPGRAKFIDEVKAYEKWLRQPDVGLALDPEWAVGPGQVPGRVFGRTSGAELDAVAGFVASVVARHRLPEKVVVYHQLHLSIVKQEQALRAHPGVVLVKSVDGIGTRAMKESTWKKVIAAKPIVVHPGFKLFYQEDRRIGPLMTPAQVMALTPTPEYILYE